MHAVEHFQAHPASDARDGPSIQLSARGRHGSVVLPGAALEQQFQVGPERYLLFVTDDVPYEPTLRVYLLDDEFRVLDGLEFGATLASGKLQDVRIIDDSTVEFSFLHRKRCRLRVQPRARWQKPLWTVPGVSRMGYRPRLRYLELAFV